MIVSNAQIAACGSTCTCGHSVAEKLLMKALDRQGLKAVPAGLKEKWSDEDGYDYEVRIHPADPLAPEGSNSKTGPTLRICRKSRARNESGQGTGPEHVDSTGNWHRQRDLMKEENSEHANNAHIPLTVTP